MLLILTVSITKTLSYFLKQTFFKHVANYDIYNTFVELHQVKISHLINKQLHDILCIV